MQSIVPGCACACDGSSMRRTFIRAPTMALASSSRRASPITSGRHCSNTMSCVRLLTTISGPTPVASPIVMPIMGSEWLMNSCIGGLLDDTDLLAIDRHKHGDDQYDALEDVLGL